MTKQDAIAVSLLLIVGLIAFYEWILAIKKGLA
jgi:hypothetical protein